MIKEINEQVVINASDAKFSYGIYKKNQDGIWEIGKYNSNNEWIASNDIEQKGIRSQDE